MLRSARRLAAILVGVTLALMTILAFSPSASAASAASRPPVSLGGVEVLPHTWQYDDPVTTTLRSDGACPAGSVATAAFVRPNYDPGAWEVQLGPASSQLDWSSGLDTRARLFWSVDAAGHTMGIGYYEVQVRCYRDLGRTIVAATFDGLVFGGEPIGGNPSFLWVGRPSASVITATAPSTVVTGSRFDVSWEIRWPTYDWSRTGPSGTVEIRDRDQLLRSLPLSYGWSLSAPPGNGFRVSISLADPGLHVLTVGFVPDPGGFDPAPVLPGTSAPVEVIVGDGPLLDGEAITATVDSGTLILSASTDPVDLGTLMLDAANARLVSTPGVQLAPVTVTDTRAGQRGWTVSGVVTDLTSGADLINGENLGWTPTLAAPVAASMVVTSGPAVPPGDGVGVGTVTGAGLRSSRVLASSAYDPATGRGSIGTVALTAGLALRAPTTTRPGVYSTTLVITAI